MPAAAQPALPQSATEAVARQRRMRIAVELKAAERVPGVGLPALLQSEEEEAGHQRRTVMALVLLVEVSVVRR